MASVSSSDYSASEDYYSLTPEESSVASETAHPNSQKPKAIAGKLNEKVKIAQQTAQVETEKAFDGLAIRKLDGSRVKKSISNDQWKYICTLPTEVQGQEIAQRIITIYNNNNRSKEPFTELDYDPSIFEAKWKPQPNFHLITYYRQIVVEFTKLAQFHRSIGARIDLSKKKTEYVLFFFRTLSKAPADAGLEIFALTTDEGWMAVEKFTDWDFSKQIAKRYSRSEVNYIEYTPLIGNSSCIKKPFKTPEALLRTKYYNKLINVLESTVRSDASLFSLNAFQNKRGQPLDLKMTVRLGYVRFGKQLNMQDYPPLLDLLSKISRGEPTYRVKLDACNNVEGFSVQQEEVDPDLTHWEDIRFVSFDKIAELEAALRNEIWRAFNEGADCALDFYHPRTDDYFRSTAYGLKFKGKRKLIAKWHRPYSAAEMIALVKEKCPELEDCEDQENLFAELKYLQVSMKTKNRIPPASFLSCFSGEVRLSSEGSFFKMGKKWHCVSTDLVSWVEEEFRHLVRQHLITKKSKGHLPTIWDFKKQSEHEYNRSYAKKEGFLVCDRICPRGVELCDLLHFDEETETFYFYHVKEGFGQKTRDACSQIRNAATQLLPALNPKAKESIIDEFVEMVESRCGEFTLCGSKEEFLSTIKNKKIVFVYAFVDSAKTERLLSRETTLQTKFSQTDFETIHDEEKILRVLIRNEYLTNDGALTSKFLCINRVEFCDILQDDNIPKEISEEIYKKLLTGVSHFKSTIARLELLNLQKFFSNKKNIEFKICQIRRDDKGSREEVTSDVLLLSKLKEVDFVEVHRGEHFILNGYYHSIDETLGDGTCALHGVLGSSQGGIFKVLQGPQAIREDLANKLREALTDQHPLITPLFRDHLKSQLLEYIRTNNNCWIADEPVKDISIGLIRKKRRLKSEIDDCRTELFEAFANLYDSSRELIDPYLPEEAGSDPIDFYQNHPNHFTLFCNQLLNVLPENDAEDMRTVDAKIKEHENALLAHEDDFVDNPTVREAYLQEILDLDYWFESNEIGLAAHLYNKHVIICHMQNRAIVLANEYNPEAGEPVVLYQEQKGHLAHFSHCTKTPIAAPAPSNPPSPQPSPLVPPPPPPPPVAEAKRVREVSPELSLAEDLEEASESEVSLPVLKRLKRNMVL